MLCLNAYFTLNKVGQIQNLLQQDISYLQNIDIKKDSLNIIIP